MNSKFSKLVFTLLTSFFFVSSISAQDIEACAYIDRMQTIEPMTQPVRERMIKLCIEDNKKEFKELIENSEEIAKLSKEIEESYDVNNKFSSNDKKKLKKVEKLLKNIRKELRAGDDDDDDEKDKPLDTVQAIKDLQEKTKNLLDEVKKTTRHTISAAAIQSSNAVLKIVKFLRFGK